VITADSSWRAVFDFLDHALCSQYKSMDTEGSPDLNDSLDIFCVAMENFNKPGPIIWKDHVAEGFLDIYR
jgi:hypothetical protein